jgi:hypothetical protein
VTVLGMTVTVLGMTVTVLGMAAPLGLTSLPMTFR